MKNTFPTLVFVFLYMCALSPAVLAQSAHYAACMDEVERQPVHAYDTALNWKAEGGGVPARHCIASALIAMGDLQRGAERLDNLGHATELVDPNLKADIFSQAAEAFLQLNQPKQALQSVDAGLLAQPADPELHAQRARALAAEGEDALAEQELDSILRRHPDDLLALQLRATVLIRQAKLQAAGQDVAHAMKLAPTDIDVLLLRGDYREASRLAAQP